MQQQLFNIEPVNLLPFKGEALLYAQFFSKEESDLYFEQLKNTIHWKQEPIKIFGREVMQPRLTAWYGDAGKAYTYSGITMHPLPWIPALETIRQKIKNIASVSFNSALLNLYRDGKDSMGWHRDNEKELGINPVIGSVSFGATRIFKLRNHQDKSLIKSIPLTHGSLLLMKGETQHYWEHHIPKTNEPAGGRINITFRVIQ